LVQLPNLFVKVAFSDTVLG
jgi:hypothetical protein